MRAAQALLGSALLAGCIFSIDESKIGSKQGSDGGPPIVNPPGDDDDATRPDASDPEEDAGTDAGPDLTPTNGLIGYWDFDDQVLGTFVVGRVGGNLAVEGTIAFDEGAPGHGTGASTNGNTALGQGALHASQFDGASFPIVGTLSMWIRSRRMLRETESGVGIANGFFDVPPNSPGRTGTYLLLAYASETSGSDNVIAGVTKPGTTFQQNVLVTRGEWNHVVITWDGLELVLWGGRAGAALTKTQKVTYPPGFDPVNQQFTLLKRMVGDIDEVRLYDRELTDGEVVRIR